MTYNQEQIRGLQSHRKFALGLNKHFIRFYSFSELAFLFVGYQAQASQCLNPAATKKLFSDRSVAFAWVNVQAFHNGTV